MVDDDGDNGTLVFWICVIVIFIWLLITSGNKDEPEYIRRDFDNGRAIEVEVDDSLTKDNWECTDGCSGHDAGYEWASENGISDPSDCGGTSVSFIEGCEAYANEDY